MHFTAALALLALLAGCASHEYSQLPEPTGEWEPANPDMGTTDNNLVPKLGWMGAQQ